MGWWDNKLSPQGQQPQDPNWTPMVPGQYAAPNAPVHTGQSVAPAQTPPTGYNSQVTPQNLTQALAAAQAGQMASHGGPGAQETAALGNCPNCGSSQYSSGPGGEGSSVFSASLNRMVSGPSMCMVCGYNSRLGNQMSAN